MQVVGASIVQNAFPEIIRMIESLRFCDKIIIIDGGSDDGTFEWLNYSKNVYPLEIYQNKFTSMTNQRNFLLSKIPFDCWVMHIDQDEAFNYSSISFFKTILDTISQDIYNMAKESYRVLSFDIPNLNLINNQYSYIFPFIAMRIKTFFYTEGIKFFGDYHSELGYSEEMKSQFIPLSCPDSFAIFHYAWFNYQRHKQRKERLENIGEEGKNELKYWFYNPKNIRKIPHRFL